MAKSVLRLVLVLGKKVFQACGEIVGGSEMIAEFGVQP
jgi:hypothetical protein